MVLSNEQFRNSLDSLHRDLGVEIHEHGITMAGGLRVPAVTQFHLFEDSPHPDDEDITFMAHLPTERGGLHYLQGYTGSDKRGGPQRSVMSLDLQQPEDDENTTWSYRNLHWAPHAVVFPGQDRGSSPALRETRSLQEFSDLVREGIQNSPELPMPVMDRTRNFLRGLTEHRGMGVSHTSINVRATNKRNRYTERKYRYNARSGLLQPEEG